MEVNRLEKVNEKWPIWLLPCKCGPGIMFERIVLTFFTKNERNLLQSLIEMVVDSETGADTVLLIVPNKISLKRQ